MDALEPPESMDPWQGRPARFELAELVIEVYGDKGIIVKDRSRAWMCHGRQPRIMVIDGAERARRGVTELVKDWYNGKDR